ncbi:MAG: hypothetical protein R3B82_15080 [Sandaracinaceae bacterium]
MDVGGMVGQLEGPRAVLRTLREAAQGFEGQGSVQVKTQRGQLLVTASGAIDEVLAYFDPLVERALAEGATGGAAIHVYEADEEGRIVLIEERRVHGTPPPAHRCRQRLRGLLVHAMLQAEPEPQLKACAKCGAEVPIETTWGSAIGVLCDPCFRARRAELDGSSS